MRVVITGAGGTLGTALAPALADAGHEPVLLDVAPLDGPYESIRADVRVAEDVARAMAGADYVVHGAAIHGVHLRDHSPDDFFELNLAGTFNVWQAAVAAGVKGVVFSSTMGVYGESGRPVDDDSIVAIDEDLPLRPTDIYGYTKVAGEEMCRYFGRQHGIPSVALRFGMFVPEPFFRYGIRLLYGGVDTDDVVGSVMAALEALIERRVTCGAYNVQSYVPFSESDGPLLRRDPLAAIERHYPGSGELLRERGVSRLMPISSYYPVARIERELGFRPQCNFDRWLAELRERPEERAASDPPWP
jgi:UDP-glucose 4-epimerase